ncbi:phosphoheptose isomerase [Marinomonas piezotolerans]|uniref:Phosphoheptose isomerase n=1 Tax=Marinomonas piezotolerans TaxID=2213058 RepID=A0A370U7D2_9GAMM|nr:AGE family epimerase/isomerase [Marinomonas piezotolerans]RDL43689.1 phosphoheptose isomerase [Marinomonas piezotolerans]
MEIPQILHKHIDACAKHVFQDLIPNWVNYGLTDQGYSRESLTIDWQPNLVGRIRLLTQCRQLFTLSYASEMGAIQGYDKQIDTLFTFIIQRYYIDGRWIFSLNDDLSIKDTQSDAYALAFVLLAFSHYYRLTRNNEALRYIELTHAFIEQHMRHPKGGVFESYPCEVKQRRQNPHMHLLEGYVAAYQATNDTKYIANIIELCDLAHNAFVDTKSKTLREFFQDDFALDANDGTLVEPGHHFEWVWLLYQTHTITRREQDLKLAEELWLTAIEHGLAENGGVYNSISGDTLQPIDSEKRIWPITEYLKACCVMALPAAEKNVRLEEALSFIRNHYFIDDGRWIEYLDGHNNSKGYPLPGTTGYHIFLGLAEVLKWQDSQI